MDLGKKSLEKISSLSSLVDALVDGNYTAVLSQFDDLEIPILDLEPYLFWNEKHYTRNCIAKDDYFELLLLCWERGQKTPIHSHDHQECFVKVLEGDFYETQYVWDEKNQSLNEIDSEFITQSEVTYVDNQSIFHTLENTHRGKSMSLHLYMKPIEKCEVYSKSEDRIIMRELSYYSENGVLV